MLRISKDIRHYSFGSCAEKLYRAIFATLDPAYTDLDFSEPQ